MLPHGRKDAKMDTKSKLFYLNEVAELYNCNNILFFEARKRQDLYMWMSKAPNGPCIKLHVQNCTFLSRLRGEVGMNELMGARLTGRTSSTHYGGTTFHRKLPQGISTNPILRLGFRRSPTHESHQGDADTHLRRPQTSPQEQTLYGPRSQLHLRRRESLVQELPNLRVGALENNRINR